MNKVVTAHLDFANEITRYQVSLRAYIYAMMPGSSGVEDVLQETNLALWIRRLDFTESTEFRAWALAVARHKIIEHRQRMSAQPEYGCDALLEEFAGAVAMESGQSNAYLHALDHCLDQLNHKERLLIERRYFVGRSLAELSQEFNRSEESLGVTLFRIRAALRKCIRGKIAVGLHQL